MATKQMGFDVDRMISEVAARHRLLLKPDDAAFALVTMNRLVLEELLETVHSRLLEDLTLFETATHEAQKRAKMVLSTQVREAAAGIRAEIQRDIRDASLQASTIVQRVAAIHQQPLSSQKFTLMVLVAVLLFLLGAWVGRISA